MRCKIIFSPILWLLITYGVQAQSINALTEEIIKIPFRSAFVSDYFHLIEKHGITLSYNAGVIDLHRQISVSPGEIKVGELLRAILPDYKVKFIEGRNRKIIIAAQPYIRCRISGTVSEHITQERLYGANLLISRNGRHVTSVSTDDAGNYTVSLRRGKYDFEIRYIGFNTLKQSVEIGNDVRLDFQMKSAPLEIKEVLIAPRKTSGELGDATPSNMLTFGNNDLFAELRILPGIIASGITSEIQVNGGGSDENLILLDGTPLFHAGHINSAMPQFNGDMIKNITFHRSSFPTRFEGRLSSVIDIKIKEGNKNRHGGTVSLDVPSASIILEGPVIKGKMSYALGGRSSWMDLFDKWRPPHKQSNMSFYDINAKIHLDISKKVSLEAFAYRTEDSYYLSGYNKNPRHRRVLYWNNQLYTLKLNSIIGNKLTNTTTASYTEYKNNARLSLLGYDSEDYLASGVKEYSLSTTFGYMPNNIYKINFGLRGSFEQFKFDGFADVRTAKNMSIGQISAFFENKIHITSGIYVQTGINFLAYLPHNNPKYYSIQPRFSIKYALNGNNLLYGGISRMAQFYRYLRIESIPLPTDMRMPTIEGFKPMSSNHFEGGWKHFFKNGSIDISVYYKKRNNIIALRPDKYPEYENWNRYIMTGSGRSYGLKAYLFNEWRRFSVQLSYTLSKSRERYSYGETVRDVPSLYDMPHVMKCALSYKTSEVSTFSAGIRLHSGRIIGINEFLFDGKEETDRGFRSMRHPFGYRIDAGYTFVKQFKKARLMLRTGLYNIIGNPTDEDFINFYSINIGKHCIPYGAVSWKF